MTRAVSPSMIATSGGTLDPNVELRSLVSQIQAEQLAMQIFMQKMVEESRLIRRATAISTLGFGLPFLFGKQSDGDETISTDTNFTSGDMKEYRNLTISSGDTLSVSAGSVGMMVLFVSDILNVQGTITMNGKGGVTGTHYASSGGGSGGGGGGSTSAVGVAGNNTLATGGTAGATDPTNGGDGAQITHDDRVLFRLRTESRDSVFSAFGAGGGNGGGGTVGGNGGGVIIIFANEVVVGGSGAITANGADGAAPSGSNGGAGGGGGGFIYIVSRNIDGGARIGAAGGSGSTQSHADGANGGDGGDGIVITEIIP